jgi:tRNA pseudouridine13 synthase
VRSEEHSLPFLTEGLPGTGGTLKEVPEDFLVEELPLYEPCGEGEHVYACIEKRGIDTREAVRRLSRALGVAEREVGYAGLKDARALTRQALSLPRVEPAQVLALEVPGLRVLSAVRHRNKLRLGHLRGNRFRVRVRQVAAGAAEMARQVLAVVEKRGVPNFFGQQRYGGQGNSHHIGRALLQGDHRLAVNLLIGDPSAVTDPAWRAALEAYRRGALAESLTLLPPFCRTEREVLRRLQARPDDWRGALRAVSPRLVDLYLSAWQSSLFDRVLAHRLVELDRLRPGDLAWKHVNGACFLVTDAAAEASRAASFEISPSGPLFGPRMAWPEGEPCAVEEVVLGEDGLSREALVATAAAPDGARRPLRVPLTEVHVAEDEDGLLLVFALPKGAYATAVLREVMKGPP